LTTATGVPIYELWIQATRSPAVGTFFLVILALCGFFAMIGCQQTASRLCWSLARDNALAGSKWLGRIHPRWGVPVWALIANAIVVFIIGCIYLGSTTAFNSMIGTGLILQQISYAMPAALLMLRGRSDAYLPSNRYFKLGAAGWVANSMTVAFAIVVVIFFNFPFVMPVSAGSMNYACVVLGVMAIFTIGNWFGYASSRYQGPRLPDELLGD
jgi:choline transport protein